MNPCKHSTKIMTMIDGLSYDYCMDCKKVESPGWNIDKEGRRSGRILLATVWIDLDTLKAEREPQKPNYIKSGSLYIPNK